jgi:multiple sugar transport system substrate-binding protein
MTTLRGINWGHRRATTPLSSATRQFEALNKGLRVEWEHRTLTNFGSGSLGDIARRFDLVVFDHPTCGEVAENGLFLSLDRDLPEELGPNADARWVGPSLDSYRLRGRIWGAPLDAAAMHAVARPDLLAQLVTDRPLTWDQSLDLARASRQAGKYVALALSPPHGFLTFASLYANLGVPLTDDPRLGSLDITRAEEAMEALVQLASLGPEAALDWDSIGLHDAMVNTNEVVFTPCEFGYATYGEADHKHRLSFGPFAGLVAPYHRGGVLGGAGLGISGHSVNVEAALTLVRYLLSANTQVEVFAERHGQPAAAAAWSDPVIDKRFNGFYSSVRPSIQEASVRPRFPGYLPIQTKGGELVRSACGGGISVAATVSKLSALLEAAADDLAAAHAPLP